MRLGEGEGRGGTRRVEGGEEYSGGYWGGWGLEREGR